MKDDASGRSETSGALVIEAEHPEGRTLDTETLRALLIQTVEAEGAKIHDLTVVLAGRDLVLRLNRQYLDHDYPTDVLAFPFNEEGNTVEGEIYVDLDTAAERCAEFDATPEDEVRRYVLHGLLHLLGYRDKTEAEQQEMRTLEDHYLAKAPSSPGA